MLLHYQKSLVLLYTDLFGLVSSSWLLQSFLLLYSLIFFGYLVSFGEFPVQLIIKIHDIILFSILFVHAEEFSVEFPKNCQIWQTSEEGWKVQQLKYCEYNNEYVNSSQNTYMYCMQKFPTFLSLKEIIFYCIFSI